MFRANFVFDHVVQIKPHLIFSSSNSSFLNWPFYEELYIRNVHAIKICEAYFNLFRVMGMF